MFSKHIISNKYNFNCLDYSKGLPKKKMFTHNAIFVANENKFFKLFCLERQIDKKN